jgi:hypothetical protein
LGASVIQCNNSASKPNCEYSKSANQVTITFEYLDYGHGFVLEVLHTGANKGAIRIEGIFKEAGPIQVFNRQLPALIRWLSFISRGFRKRYRKPRSKSRRGLAVFSILMGVVTLSLATVLTVDAYYSKLFDVVTVGDKQYGVVEPDFRIKTDGERIVAYRPHRSVIIARIGFVAIGILSLANFWFAWWVMRTGVPYGLEQYEDRLNIGLDNWKPKLGLPSVCSRSYLVVSKSSRQ